MADAIFILPLKEHHEDKHPLFFKIQQIQRAFNLGQFFFKCNFTLVRNPEKVVNRSGWEKTRTPHSGDSADAYCPSISNPLSVNVAESDWFISSIIFPLSLNNTYGCRPSPAQTTLAVKKTKSNNNYFIHPSSLKNLLKNATACVRFSTRTFS